MQTGTLFVAATPIGNMEDITLRALRVLSEVDYILCEDTRVTGNLLKHHGIKNKLVRHDVHASEKAHETILQDLASGKHIALVSDAGTPGVSDPGVLLIARASKAGAHIVAIPGASALTAAFSIAGLSGNAFTFLGFVPHKKGRETLFKSLVNYDTPVIFYESPHRIMKTLESLVKYLPETATVTIAREITKLHEEIVQDTPKAVLAYFNQHEDHIRGEFVVLVSK